MFEVIPAIDILGGKCVRLKQGRYESPIIYSPDPVDVARQWAAAGARRLHVVDLDGARTGTPENIALIKTIIKEAGLPVQAGGGIRNFTTISELLGYGADRIILGTTAIKNPNLLSSVCEKFDDRIAVAIDAKGNFAAAEGWMYVSKKDVLTLAKEAIGLGVRRFIYTEISRDGMLAGPNFEGIRAFAAATGVAVIASGGISSKEDILKLKELGVEGCIVGKALYEGKIKPEDLTV
ncbi:MAG: 1-(5-phosphoribosyl)-5-[(5-phosphoribosylamino)methylideneamino]imidazole-4-carboxamide isomerase [Candidatus Saganbacteria bacterium]|nr:1-(5-phosphoribosyl)-5-[(5-phosphoribosylamino)methylideneamino]imidazole-4-carboxamide isomerase [Candidatus Saganbacteria bacterium]